MDKQKLLLGVTGEIGCGKSFASRTLCKLAKHSYDMSATHISCDNLGKEILGVNSNYYFIRKEIAEKFSQRLLNKDTSINLDALRDVIFNDKEKLEKYNQIMQKSFKIAIQSSIDDSPNGLILLETALLAETRADKLTNYNTLIVKASKDVQLQRLNKRDIRLEELKKRLEHQLNYEQKRERLLNSQKVANQGFLLTFDTSNNPVEKDYRPLMDKILQKFYLSI